MLRLKNKVALLLLLFTKLTDKGGEIMIPEEQEFIQCSLCDVKMQIINDIPIKDFENRAINLYGWERDKHQNLYCPNCKDDIIE